MLVDSIRNAYLTTVPICYALANKGLKQLL